MDEAIDGESVDQERATLDDVRYCYRLFLRRRPDRTGFGAYADEVTTGITISDLVSYFVGCPEWIDRGLYRAQGNTNLVRVDTAEFPIYVIKSDPVVARELIATRDYEPHLTNRLRTHFRRGFTFVDIGANVGFYSLLAAKHVGSEGRVIAFEPNSDNLKALVLNKLINDCSQIDVYPFAVSDTQGMLSLMKIVSIASTKKITAEELQYLNDAQVVYAVTLDQMLKDEPRIDVVKCDIDGHDHLAMAGAAATIRRTKPLIVAEFNPASLHSCSGVSGADYLGLLDAHGYRFTVVLRTGEAVPCSTPAGVLEVLARSGYDQVDLWLEPTGAPADSGPPAEVSAPDARHGSGSGGSGNGEHSRSAASSGSSSSPSIPAAVFATALYRGLLGREPDPAGFAHTVAMLEGGSDPTAIIQSFMGSEEFSTGFERSMNRYPLDCAAPMAIESRLDERDMQAFWDHIAAVWANYGRTDPYWSVLTAEQFRAHHMDREAALEAFYKTGRDDLHRLDAWLVRNGLRPDREGICAEYGCGVGRVTLSLARQFRRVRALDISEPHLEAARDRLSGEGIDNVDYVLIRGRDDLSALSGVDFFYSFLVLQHNPPPIIVDVLSRAFAGLNPGGIAFFQVPTYARGYTFTPERYWVDTAARKEMEVHFVPQLTIFELASAQRVDPIEVQPDHMIGGWGQWISNTFLMRKRA